MRVLLQKVANAQVSVAKETVGHIDHGLLLFLGVTEGDTEAEATWLAEKVLKLRLFSDSPDTFMEKNVLEVEGSILVVSQFTLYGDCQKGTKPSFTRAARPDVAEPLYEFFCQVLRERGVSVSPGRFGAHMDVTLTNDGPVTLIIEKDASH